MPVWQVIYEELRGEGLEIIAVAFDTAGAAAVEGRIRAADIDERPDVLAALMGWAPDLWGRQAPPTYPCLIDESHVVADLYGMTNVPQAVWIDERGRIVRPAESAGVIDMAKYMNRETFELPEEVANKGVDARNSYIEALRDWVRNGADSAFALPPDEVKRRLRGPGENDVRAATHVKLGRYLFRKNALDAAKQHFAEASRLSPDSWNYRRQSMMLDPESVGELNAGPDFWAAVDALGDADYYPPADLTPA